MTYILLVYTTIYVSYFRHESNAYPHITNSKSFYTQPSGLESWSQKVQLRQESVATLYIYLHRSIFNISTKMKNSCQKFYRDNAFNNISKNAWQYIHILFPIKFQILQLVFSSLHLNLYSYTLLDRTCIQSNPMHI